MAAPIDRDKLISLIAQARVGSRPASEELARLDFAGMLPHTEGDDPTMQEVAAILRGEHLHPPVAQERMRLFCLHLLLDSDDVHDRIKGLIGILRRFGRTELPLSDRASLKDEFNFWHEKKQALLRQLVEQRFHELHARSAYDEAAFDCLFELLHGKNWYKGLAEVTDPPAFPANWDYLVALHRPTAKAWEFARSPGPDARTALLQVTIALVEKDFVLGAWLIARAFESGIVPGFGVISQDGILDLQMMVTRARARELAKLKAQAAGTAPTD